jgi:hypothetical protein
VCEVPAEVSCKPMRRLMRFAGGPPLPDFARLSPLGREEKSGVRCGQTGLSPRGCAHLDRLRIELEKPPTPTLVRSDDLARHPIAAHGSDLWRRMERVSVYQWGTSDVIVVMGGARG